MSVAEVLDRSIQPMGHINPEVPPLTEKQNVFSTTAAEDEKAGGTYVGVLEESDIDQHEHLDTDPFEPFNDLPDEDRRIITIRAVLLGCCCGALVGASNLYLGLKTGWTFSANLFGAIIGFAVLKPLSRALPQAFPILGGDFGPRENNIVQTAATAAGGLSSVFVSGIPALYQLGLLSAQPKEDFGRLIALTVVGGYFGFAFGTPLRKFFIIYVARELRLIFPTASATAMTIRSMHLATTGEAFAKLKMRGLGISFTIAFLLRVVSQYAVGILWDWHIFTWFFIWSGYHNGAMQIENWTWLIEFTPAFIGSGMLVGLNTGISFFAGSFLAWAIIGPALVAQGMAFGKSFGYDAPWDGYINYMSLNPKFTTADHPSPRYWLLWPGVLLMIVVSFTELALQWRIFYFVSKAIYRGTCKYTNELMKKTGRSSAYLEKNGKPEKDQLVEDIYPDNRLVQWWMWLPLLVAVIICSCVVLGVQYQMPVGMSLLSVFLAFFFSLLAVQCTGVTDVTPLTAASKASQIVLGGATKGEGWAVDQAQRLNLLGGSLASMGANQATDLVVDFRVGFLLRTPPKQQWLAQAIGTLVAVFLAPALFILFTTAYPCVLDLYADTCAFGGPSISAWRAVAQAMTDSTFPVPKSSGIFSIVFSIFGGVMVVIRHYAYRGTWEKYRVYHPNMMCIGLAFVLPYTVYSTATLAGSIVAYVWAKRNPKSFDIYGYAVAAGFIAGEGIGGFINAVFEVAGISGTYYGTSAGCPAWQC
ncbi:hypothetical protein AMS68_004198 [Peltaster fructicola]|uniref:Oligopeptide transporter n=1 Tax=Peltaster fructicola TaxID=286661 RepID=A0A6H0XVJ6_9PEZI|nr:hypothetical protein AMS68_004198 [Peltaster fructicola]